MVVVAIATAGLPLAEVVDAGGVVREGVEVGAGSA